MDYSRYYDLEQYLFQEVSRKFKENRFIDAFDFFCIIIWKANRAKSKIAKKIKTIAEKDNLDFICKIITSKISNLKSKEERLQFLLKDWEFRLPTASAILAVLYPNDFTVYDSRVCQYLEKYKNLSNKTKIDNIIEDYFKFVEDVKIEVPSKYTLREKDRFLWGKSIYEQLKRDIQEGFKKK